MPTIRIPKTYMGTTLQEDAVKSYLRSVNPDIHFDMGANLNLWHPMIECRQGLCYRGKTICAMDRRTLPEIPIWTITKDAMEVPWSEVRYGEIAMTRTVGVRGECKKCLQIYSLPHRPVGVFVCRCGNIGMSHDPIHFGWEDVPASTAIVIREQRDKIVLVGWRHTFRKLLAAKVPGVTKDGLEREFRIDLTDREVDAMEIDELREVYMTDQSLVA